MMVFELCTLRFSCAVCSQRRRLWSRLGKQLANRLEQLRLILLLLDSHARQIVIVHIGQRGAVDIIRYELLHKVLFQACKDW